MISDVFVEVMDKMDCVVEVVKDDFVMVCIGCVNLVLFFKILVEYYGMLILFV